MSLFQNSVLNKYLKGLESEKVNQAYDRFKSHFHNPTIQENIRNSKEEQYQGEFLIDLFVNVFDYTKNPTPNFNLTTELKNIKGSKKTDGAILKGEKALAVIELKGTNTTDLSKVETQAFGYKNNHPGCNYVMTSNFEKLRFYIDNAVDFEEFNLFQLTKERFYILWLCLSSEYLLKDIPKKIKNESLTQEENITKELYKDYASFRNEVFDSIQKENPEYDKLTLFKKTQKLLDRFLFIFFAEDRLLLPPNSIRSIVTQWTDLRDKYDEYFPLYDRFRKYFGYMNTGHKGHKHDIFAYNGGLFAPDEILDNIKIDDELLHKHTVNLSNYDFESEVSVNILGHIFEHSLNDIDNIKGLQSPGQSKRKKDGVFYTPKYITKYIVDNTVGKLCEEKKTELDIQEADYEKERKGRKKATIKKLTQKIEDYRKWLLQISICDPACGSGAFLNQALEFLIAEHKYIDELQAKLFGDAMVLSEVENAILENNLFGVDINEESVEIAKLSLWLRTAQKGRKLTSLNKNIKCGNSLIDDTTVAGDKAFHWQTEFPSVFTEKNKKAYHITTAIHDSRTSARMEKYKVRERRDMGTNPYPNVIYFTPEDDLQITQSIAEIVKEDDLKLLAYNICADHIHLLLVCDIEEVPAIMQKIKGRTSYYHGPHSGHNGPCSGPHNGLKSIEKKEKKKPLWQQKYSAPKEVTSQEQLHNTLRYIQTNRNKHELPAHSKKVEKIIDQMCCSLDEAFAPAYTGGFDVVIGNPPYVQLQKIKEHSLKVKEMGYQTYKSTGDLYCLFYEKGYQILKDNGLLGYITSNKWMRANYGKNLRQFFVKYTNPKLLLDLGAGIFEGAVVDSNILVYKKEVVEKQSIKALTIENGKVVRDFTPFKKDFVNITPEKEDIWVVQSQIKQNIHKKIEQKGTPLKEWDLEINYGIKTGYNDAFIIDKATKDRLIQEDPKSAELLKPILRGRDIKRYNADFADLWVVATFPSKNIEIDRYPAIKKHLQQFGKKLEQTGKSYIDEDGNKQKSRKKTTNNWFETQDTIAYFEEFLKKKIFYREIGTAMNAVLVENETYVNNKLYLITGENIEFLTLYFNSKLFNNFHYSKASLTGGKGQTFLEKIPIPKITKIAQQPFIQKADQILFLNKNLQAVKSSFLKLLQSKFSLTKLSKNLQNWHELDFGIFLKELKKARKKAAKTADKEFQPLGLGEEAEWMQYFNEQKEKAQELKTHINKTDREIDQMVYELYGLTEEEIKVVEEATS